MTKEFGKTKVLHGISLDIADGEFMVLVGVGDSPVTVITHGRSGVGPGQKMPLSPQPQHAHLFDAASGARIELQV